MYHLHPPVRLLVGMLVGVKEGEREEGETLVRKREFYGFSLSLSDEFQISI